MLFEQIDCATERGEGCPGEAECRETRGKPLNKYSGGTRDEIERICDGCSLVRSKPERVPLKLQQLAATAYELSELNAAGARFDYPDALVPHEWMALVAMSRARNRAETAQRKRDEVKAKRHKR